MNNNTSLVNVQDNVNTALSLVNLLRSTSSDMIVELSGEAGLHIVLELIADRLETVKTALDEIRGRVR